MKKVLILKFPYSSLFGGGEQHTLMLVESLLTKGFSFYLATSCPVLLEEFKKINWPAKKVWGGREPVSKGALLLWPFQAPFAFLNLLRHLLVYRISKKVKILYCLSLTEKILVTLPAKVLGMKVIWVEHVTIDRWLSLNPLKVFYKFLSRYVTIVAVSEVVKKQLIEKIGINEKNIVIIYSGVNIKKFAIHDNRWGEAARYNIGCIARIEKEKGIEFLIQAIKIVKEFVPFVRLIVVGDGKEKKKLAWLAERLGLKENIQWVGRQREIEKWYNYFDAYVLPSVIRESFGITIIEAMASGVPVIGSRIGGVPEIITHRENGLLAKPGDSGDLADQLMYLYNNRSEIRDMTIAARNLVEEKFSLERMARDYYLLFRK
ncbi:MAG: glycosyltransferase family 4 protein [Candidatus Kerfeldbacteria bacterium]|jgi:glycosyltransferase involved in cell wall biosynthesis